MSTNYFPRPVRRAEVYKETLENESVLIDPRTGTIHSLNLTAALVWDHCDGKHQIRDIAGKILNQYNAARSQVEKDVRQMIDRLHKLDLIVLVDGRGRRGKKKKDVDGS